MVQLEDDDGHARIFPTQMPFLRTLSDLQDCAYLEHEKEYEPIKESDELCGTCMSARRISRR